MLVKAKSMGYRDNRRIREGEVFDLPDELVKVNAAGEIISPRWVEAVDAPEKAKKPLKLPGVQVKPGRSAAKQALSNVTKSTGDAEVI